MNKNCLSSSNCLTKSSTNSVKAELIHKQNHYAVQSACNEIQKLSNKDATYCLNSFENQVISLFIANAIVIVFFHIYELQLRM